jgi:hypothetical protein
MGITSMERLGMKGIGIRALFTAACCGACLLNARASEPEAPEAAPKAGPADAPTVLVLVGAPGDKEYEDKFPAWAETWKDLSAKAGARHFSVGLDIPSSVSDLDRFKALLGQEPQEGERELWIILLGHGTFDGKEAKFNLRGPDLSASELAELLKPFRRPIAVINTTAASSPFLNKLSAPGRVIITSTRSGYEQSFARFGQFFSAAIADGTSDLDKDGQVSLLEAYLMASRQVAEFYKTEGRLASEHPLLDDNGDGLGTPPDWFRGIRAIKKPTDGASLDGLRAHQFHLVRSEAEQHLSPALRAKRNELELAVEDWRQSKSKLPPDEYYAKLETLLLDLARLYDEGETSPQTLR